MTPCGQLLRLDFRFAGNTTAPISSVPEHLDDTPRAMVRLGVPPAPPGPWLTPMTPQCASPMANDFFFLSNGHDPVGCSPSVHGCLAAVVARCPNVFLNRSGPCKGVVIPTTTSASTQTTASTRSLPRVLFPSYGSSHRRPSCCSTRYCLAIPPSHNWVISQPSFRSLSLFSTP